MTTRRTGAMTTGLGLTTTTGAGLTTTAAGRWTTTTAGRRTTTAGRTTGPVCTVTLTCAFADTVARPRMVIIAGKISFFIMFLFCKYDRRPATRSRKPHRNGQKVWRSRQPESLSRRRGTYRPCSTQFRKSLAFALLTTSVSGVSTANLTTSFRAKNFSMLRTASRWIRNWRFAL